MPHSRIVIVVAIAALAIGLPLASHAAINVGDGNILDWGWNPVTKAFDTPGAFTDGVCEFSIWADDVTNPLNAGNEWYDIEGLYVDIEADLAGNATKINWCLVTSYAGLEQNNEWYPKFNGGANPEADTGTYAPNYGIDNTAAGQRNAKWHRNPTIGLDLDGAAGFEWGLVMDPSDTASRGTIGPGTPKLFDMGDQSAWIDSRDFPNIWKDIDFDRTAASVTDQSVAGSAYRKYLYSEGPPPDQMNPPLRQDYNWFWEGSIDVTGLGIKGSDSWAQKIQYAMWCGNDGVTAEYRGEYTPPSPELSTWLLLGLSLAAVPALRRRRRS